MEWLPQCVSPVLKFKWSTLRVCFFRNPFRSSVKLTGLGSCTKLNPDQFHNQIIINICFFTFAVFNYKDTLQQRRWATRFRYVENVNEKWVCKTLISFFAQWPHTQSHLLNIISMWFESKNEKSVPESFLSRASAHWFFVSLQLSDHVKI